MKHPPFLRIGPSLAVRIIWTYLSLLFLASVYTFFFDHTFILFFILYSLVGLGLEISFFFLKEGKFKIKSGSSAITSALLVLSIPPHIPPLYVFFALIFSIIFVRLSFEGDALPLNPMLCGRLFLMIAYPSAIVAWNSGFQIPDGLTSATPLELYHSEKHSLNLLTMFTGNIHGEWGDLYALSSGSPGEIFKPFLILIGLILCLKKIIDWRPGIFFLISFSVSNWIFDEPVYFNLFSGAVIFSAIYIAGDPKSTPVTPGGKILMGILAGLLNALIRKYTYYSEGIVFAFLTANILTPLTDQIVFFIKSKIINKRQRTKILLVK